MQKRYGKLIRDRIPEIIDEAGRQCTVRRLEEDEFRIALHHKLQEELDEYLAQGEPVELADLLEVIYALLEQHGMTPAQLEQLRQEKAAARGAFRERIWLESVEELTLPPGWPPFPTA